MRLTINEMKKRLDELAQRANSGESVVITKDGQPFVQLIAYQEPTKKQFGQYPDTFEMGDDFDSQQVNDEIALSFYQGVLA